MFNLVSCLLKSLVSKKSLVSNDCGISTVKFSLSVWLLGRLQWHRWSTVSHWCVIPESPLQRGKHWLSFSSQSYSRLVFYSSWRILGKWKIPVAAPAGGGWVTRLGSLSANNNSDFNESVSEQEGIRVWIALLLPHEDRSSLAGIQAQQINRPRKAARPQAGKATLDKDKRGTHIHVIMKSDLFYSHNSGHYRWILL